MRQAGSILLALIATLAGPSLQAQAMGTEARGGLYDGMTFGRVLYSDPHGRFIALGSPRTPSPVPAAQARLVHDIIDAIKTKRSAGVVEIKTGATYEACGGFDLPCGHGAFRNLSDIFDKLPDPSEYAPTGAYELPDGRIRVEWQKGSDTWYLTVLTFEGRKLADITTVPSAIPVKLHG